MPVDNPSGMTPGMTLPIKVPPALGLRYVHRCVALDRTACTLSVISSFSPEVRPVGGVRLTLAPRSDRGVGVVNARVYANPPAVD